MKILIGCEKSQVVCKAFRALGHEAYSCDILPCTGGHPEWHIQGNVLDILKPWMFACGKMGIQIQLQNGDYYKFIGGWDLAIFHPPCTYLSHAGARWLYPNHVLNQDRYMKGLAAKEFFMSLFNCSIPKIAVENPMPQKVYCLPKETQIIHPLMFGHRIQKATYLWLKNLPLLQPTQIVEPEFYYDKKGIRHTLLNNWNADKSSTTFTGIAEAMATQWGNPKPDLLLATSSAMLKSG